MGYAELHIGHNKEVEVTVLFGGLPSRCCSTVVAPLGRIVNALLQHENYDVSMWQHSLLAQWVMFHVKPARTRLHKYLMLGGSDLHENDWDVKTTYLPHLRRWLDHVGADDIHKIVHDGQVENHFTHMHVHEAFY